MASFTISAGASITIGTTQQESGITSNNFSSTVTYTITAQDGTQQDWVVTVTSAPVQSSEKDILSFSFDEQTGQATIETVDNTVDIEVIYGTDLTNLVATFTISTNATATIGTTQQESGVTVNDFSLPVILYIENQQYAI